MRQSNFHNHSRLFQGEHTPTSSLMIYRHGTLGDALICTALVRLIRKRNPDAMIAIYCQGSCADLYRGLGVAVHVGFPTMEDAASFEHHLCLEEMLECDQEPDQANCYDAMFRFAGFNAVSDAFKRPSVIPFDDDWNFEGNPVTPKFDTPKFIALQTMSGSAMRCYPHREELIECLRGTLPDYEIWCIGNEEGVDVGMVRSIATPKFRNLIPIIYGASLFIGTDSAISHLVAATETKALTLWGPLAPQDRQKYYRHHHAIEPITCPHYPCRWNTENPPVTFCKDSEGFSLSYPACNALAGIAPQRIADKAAEILK